MYYGILLYLSVDNLNYGTLHNEIKGDCRLQSKR